MFHTCFFHARLIFLDACCLAVSAAGLFIKPGSIQGQTGMGQGGSTRQTTGDTESHILVHFTAHCIGLSFVIQYQLKPVANVEVYVYRTRGHGWGADVTLAVTVGWVLDTLDGDCVVQQTPKWIFCYPGI